MNQRFQKSSADGQGDILFKNYESPETSRRVAIMEDTGSFSTIKAKMKVYKKAVEEVLTSVRGDCNVRPSGSEKEKK